MLLQVPQPWSVGSARSCSFSAREGPLGPGWDENVHELERVLARYEHMDAE
jgi:hypothetical protein